VTSSTFTILSGARRIVLPCVAAAALLVPAAAWADAAGPGPGTGTIGTTLPDLPPADPDQTTPEVIPAPAALPDLAPADPTAVGRPVVPITFPDQVNSFGTPGRIAEPSTLPDLAPANATQVSPETPAILPDLPPADPTQVAPVGQTAGDDGFDFGDAGIGVAVVAGACAFLLAVAAFLVGRRRRLGASHS
jgi:hypothetical protein